MGNGRNYRFQKLEKFSKIGHKFPYFFPFLNTKCVGTAFVCINWFFIGYWILKAGWISILALFL
jgi:glycerol-3-phosphate acyltransferase PlsY